MSPRPDDQRMEGGDAEERRPRLFAGVGAYLGPAGWIGSTPTPGFDAKASTFQ